MNRIILSAIVVVACAPTVTRAATIFRADLTGAQEVPSVVTSAFGSASLVLNDAMTELSYEVTVKGLDFGGFFTADPNDNLTRIHIHDGNAGVNGPILFGILSPAHDLDMLTIMLPATDEVKFTGKWNAADVLNGAAPLGTQLADLFSEGLYFNVHTTGRPGGEIRGQIYQVPEPSAFVIVGVGCVALLRCRSRWLRQQ